MNAGKKRTPVMQQHADAKRAYPDAIVFFRMGDFYEMFGEDAVLCSKVLNLALTSRSKGKPDEIEMAGVPHHSAHGYIGRLLQAGYRVAICEQMADPKQVRGIVPRSVVRVLTPGLVTHDEHLREKENNWLAGIEVGDQRVAVALLDISTGELRAAERASLTDLLALLHQAAPREILLGGPADGGELESARAAVEQVLGRVSVQLDGPLPSEQVPAVLKELHADAQHFSVDERFALGRVVRFAERCHPGQELPLRAIGRWDPNSTLVIDPSTEQHLELVRSNQGERRGTLLDVIDQCETPPGSRLLRRRLLAPLLEVASIRRRLDAVESFVLHAALREQVRGVLHGVGDLERRVSRVELGDASPQDLAALRDGLRAAQRVVELLLALDATDREVLSLAEPPDCADEVREELVAALVERPSPVAKEGAIFAPGYDATLSEFDAIRQNGSELIVQLETRLRQETDIPSLKVKFTRVFGWYIEVTRAGLKKVPPQWRRKQTVAGGERYTLDELDELAEQLSHADERHRARELELLSELSAKVRRAAKRIRALSQWLAEIDVAAALAEVAHRYDYCRPQVDESTRIQIEDGRHPVVERLAASGRFVPNDVELDAEQIRLWMITGPNMAGKSTFLRQVALCCILAQMGSFVPAGAAHIGLVDRVLSRVGASDNLAQGESTFMVEMRETANILRSATARSLVILDEIGRGTSTYDGLAIAWAVAEHLDEGIGCRALFATHYHELTQLAELSKHIDNYSVSARELQGDIVFLHRVVHGAASRSYGVAVAKLAGVPETVLARAQALLAGFEGQASSAEDVAMSPSAPRVPRARGKQRRNQLSLFGKEPEPDSAGNEVLHTLRVVDVERLSPLDALQLLVKLKKRL